MPYCIFKDDINWMKIKEDNKHVINFQWLLVLKIMLYGYFLTSNCSFHHSCCRIITHWGHHTTCHNRIITQGGHLTTCYNKIITQGGHLKTCYNKIITRDTSDNYLVSFLQKCWPTYSADFDQRFPPAIAIS